MNQASERDVLGYGDRAVGEPASAAVRDHATQYGTRVAQTPSTHHGILSEELRAAVGQSAGNAKEVLQALMSAFNLNRTVAAAARRWNVHPLAIVGAITWEAIMNPRFVSVRASGLAKMHFRENFPPFGEGEPLAEQLEEIGYLAILDMEERRDALTDPKVAVDYVAAAFHAFSVLAEKHGYMIREDLGVLGFAYNAMKLDSWDKHLEKKKRASLRGGEMGAWIEQNSALLREIYPDKSWSLSSAAQSDPIIREADARLLAREW